jgi:negative regulator of replication initiation
MIDEKLWEVVKSKAVSTGFSISAIIRALLKMWANGDVEIQL